MFVYGGNIVFKIATHHRFEKWLTAPFGSRELGNHILFKETLDGFTKNSENDPSRPSHQTKLDDDINRHGNISGVGRSFGTVFTGVFCGNTVNSVNPRINRPWTPKSP